MIQALQPGRWKPASGARTRGIIDLNFLGLKTADKKEEGPPPPRAEIARPSVLVIPSNPMPLENHIQGALIPSFFRDILAQK
jgi:hypothetical protein